MLDVCFGINQSILCENHDGEQSESAKEEDEGVLLHGAALESADGGAQTVGAPSQEVVLLVGLKWLSFMVIKYYHQDLDTRLINICMTKKIIIYTKALLVLNF